MRSLLRLFLNTEILVSKQVPRQISLTRSLRMSCCTYMPRRRQAYINSSDCSEAYVQMSFVGEKISKKKSLNRDAKKDINSIDLVVLKYTEFLNSLNDDEDSEHVYLTNFGSIRFDNDNLPGRSPSEELTNDFSSATKDDVYLEDKRISGRSPNEGTTTDSFSVTKGAICSDSKGVQTVPLPFNYVDEVYFSDYFRKENKNESAQPLKIMENEQQSASLKEGVQNEDCKLGSDNYIDEIYFPSLIRSSGSTSAENVAFSSQNCDATASQNYIEDAFIAESEISTAYNSSTITGSKTSPSNGDSEENFVGTPSVTSISDSQSKMFSSNLSNVNKEQSSPLQHKDSSCEELNNDPPGESNTTHLQGSQSAYNFEEALTLSGTEEVKISRSSTSKIIVPDIKSIQPPCSISIDVGDNVDSVQGEKVKEGGLDKKLTSFPPVKNDRAKTKEEPGPLIDQKLPSGSLSAYDFVLKMRQEEDAEILESKGHAKYKEILRHMINFKDMTNYEILALLKRSILYDKYDIVALYKPYGLMCQMGPSEKRLAITEYLPDLAKAVKAENLHTIHRLDRSTTGVYILAKSEAMAEKMRAMFAAHKAVKIYFAITKGIPSPTQGVIDIPVAEGTIGEQRRMVLRPNVEGFRGKAKNSKLAITQYQVLSSANSSSLLQLKSMTGVKHQVRVHLGFGLGCPVMGDHKYSHLRKMAPQRLPGDMLDHLQMKQSRVRDLPIFLHARSICLPGIIDGKDFYVEAALPTFFRKALRFLELDKKKNMEVSKRLTTLKVG